MGNMFNHKVAELMANVDTSSVASTKKDEKNENKPSFIKSDKVQIIKDGEIRVVKKKKLATYLGAGWEERE